MLKRDKKLEEEYELARKNDLNFLLYKEEPSGIGFSKTASYKYLNCSPEKIRDMVRDILDKILIKCEIKVLYSDPKEPEKLTYCEFKDTDGSLIQGVFNPLITKYTKNHGRVLRGLMQGITHPALTAEPKHRDYGLSISAITYANNRLPNNPDAFLIFLVAYVLKQLWISCNGDLVYFGEYYGWNTTNGKMEKVDDELVEVIVKCLHWTFFATRYAMSTEIMLDEIATSDSVDFLATFFEYGVFYIPDVFSNKCTVCDCKFNPEDFAVLKNPLEK